VSKTKKAAMQYFITNHNAYDYKRDWYRVPTCPFCGREEKLGVNYNNNRAHCFRCEYDESLLQAVMDIEGIPSLTATVKFLKDIDISKIKLKPYIPVPEREVVLPNGFRILSRGYSRMGEMARNYVRNRGFDVIALSRMGVGYTIDSESKYWGYLIVPFHRDGEVVYFQTRKYFGNGPKFNNPTYEDFGVGKTQILYNEKALKRFRELHLVESWTNGWTMGENFVSLSGKVLSPKQKELIIRSKAKVINIMLDLDAWDYAMDIAFELIDFKRLRVIRFQDDRDVNELGRSNVNSLVDQSPILTKFGEVIMLKNKYYGTKKRNHSNSQRAI
jgi:hypothetical protein